MPTKPLKRLLDRDLQKVRAEPVIQLACPLLREIINYGTNLFARCEASTSHARVEGIPGEGHLVILLLYRHIIEMIDAVEALLAQSITTPSLTLLRSAFEAYLQLEWILKEDTLRRVYAYLVYDINNRLKTYRTFDLSSEQGKQLQAKINNDKWASSMSFPKVENLDAKIDNLEKLLMQEHFTDVNAAYNPKAPWYRIFGGPLNLEQLAEKLELPYWYEVLYRESSYVTHAAYLARNLRGRAIQVLRDSADLSTIAEMVINIGIYATEGMINFYRSGEIVGFWQWYKREIAGGSARLAGQP
jgi:hypothetical protein